MREACSRCVARVNVRTAVVEADVADDLVGEAGGYVSLAVGATSNRALTFGTTESRRMVTMGLRPLKV